MNSLVLNKIVVRPSTKLYKAKDKMSRTGLQIHIYSEDITVLLPPAFVTIVHGFLQLELYYYAMNLHFS